MKKVQECLAVLCFVIVTVHAVQIDTVTQLNISQYIGRWYQVLYIVTAYNTPIFAELSRCTLTEQQNWLSREDVIVWWKNVRITLYESNSTYVPCITWLDGLSDKGAITALIACRLGAPNGTSYTQSGMAYRPNPDEQGKFMVKLNGSLALSCKSHLDRVLYMHVISS